MKIIKRNGAEESFDTLKIVNAVQKACNATENAYLAPEQLTDIADYVEYKCNKLGRAVSVEEIQDMVPSLYYLKELAEYFKVSPDYLLGRTDDRN